VTEARKIGLLNAGGDEEPGGEEEHGAEMGRHYDGLLNVSGQQ
jgi:hypothetical protein